MTYSVWGIGRLHTLPLEQKSDGARALALPLTERCHQLLEFCRPLNLEEDFIAVVGDLDVEMLRGGRTLGLLGRSCLGVICHLLLGMTFAGVCDTWQGG